ncbi:unnamed protein product [Arctia plantaginis]|uniref:Uncharacterized protein n=1 Tax=Arctia plantaginis TaxID=874455 RepID=A0A8S0Z2B8_ARCPL|nr:unnamed protein product [Arctia plantaginis]
MSPIHSDQVKTCHHIQELFSLHIAIFYALINGLCIKVTTYHDFSLKMAADSLEIVNFPSKVSNTVVGGENPTRKELLALQPIQSSPQSHGLLRKGDPGPECKLPMSPKSHKPNLVQTLHGIVRKPKQ